MQPPDWVHVATRLEPDEEKQLREIAKNNERSVAQELRLIIRAHIAEQVAGEKVAG